MKKPRELPANGVTNTGFCHDHGFDGIQTSNVHVETLKLEDNSSIHSGRLVSMHENQLNPLPRFTNATLDETDTPPGKKDQKAEMTPKMAQVKIIKTKIECVQLELEDVTHSPLKELDLSRAEFATELKPLQKSNIDPSKLNEISSVDEIKHTCIERREPNGTIYFVEVNTIQNAVENNEASAPEQPKVDELEKSIKKRVLIQSDVESKATSNVSVIPLKIESVESEPEEEEKEVRAIVHTPNLSLLDLETDTKNSADSEKLEEMNASIVVDAANVKKRVSNDISHLLNWQLGGSDEKLHVSNEKIDILNKNSGAVSENSSALNYNFDDSNEIFNVMDKSIEVLDEVLDALDEELGESSEKSSISNANVGSIMSLVSYPNITVSDSIVTVKDLIKSDTNSVISDENSAYLKQNLLPTLSSTASTENLPQNTANLTNISKTVNLITAASSSANETVPGVIRPIDPSSKRPYAKRLPNFQMGIYEAIPKQKLLYEKDKERLAFKMRLENLFNQDDEKATLKHPKSNFNSPMAMHSQRMLLNHSKSAPKSLIIPNDDVEPTTSDVNTALTPSQIPIAPVFNEQLYDTIGRRNRKPFSSVSDVIDIDSTINDHVVLKGNLSRTKAHENLTELYADANVADVEDVQPESIKQKLEQILSKGRAATQADQLDFQRNNNANIRRHKPHEPFDTVRRQKMLFSDVLKSIGPDIHTNLHQTHGIAADDIKETIQRRDSLD